ncbi:MAG TPA: sugar phosphate isomerase/epimerase [Pyrinomonadaceae bacterium]|jgi:2-keto-myo-inositol isomerase|nr:sugar phosphate isomerase/epimerase [Pyrinomonadaceae bacterium]
MKLALNGATTMRADLATDLSVAGAAGFDYLEIWAAKLRDFLKNNSTADLKNLFAKHNLQPLSINSIEHITFRDAQAYESIKQQCDELSQIAAEIDCPCIVVVPGRIPPSGAIQVEVIDESVRVLNELCDIAEKHGVSLAFEFLGQTDCTVQTLALAHEIVRTANRDNLGLVIDSFHFYAGGSTIEMIEALDPQLLSVFHINDAEDRPREELNDSHRLLPGLGILPLLSMIGAFQRIGYDGVASVEIFRPEYWEMDPLEVAKNAYVATRGVLASLFPVPEQELKQTAETAASRNKPVL